MKTAATILLLCFSTLCAAQFKAKDIKDMKRLLDEAPLTGYVGKLLERYDGMTTERAKLPLVAITDPAVAEALTSGTKRTTGPYPSTDGLCALVRVVNTGSDEWARVNYIYLSKASGTDEELRQRADSILQAIRNGWAFGDAALKYSMDGNGKRGGDMGWFTHGMMVPEFGDPVFEHHKGDLYTVRVDIYGWYVVEVTGAPDTYEQVEYILGRGPICR